MKTQAFILMLVTLMSASAVQAVGFQPTAWGEQWKSSRFELRFNLMRDDNMVLDVKYAELLCKGIGVKQNLDGDAITPVVHLLWYYVRSEGAEKVRPLADAKAYYQLDDLAEGEFATLYRDPDYGTELGSRIDFSGQPDLVKQIHANAVKICKGEKVEFDDPYEAQKQR